MLAAFQQTCLLERTRLERRKIQWSDCNNQGLKSGQSQINGSKKVAKKITKASAAKSKKAQQTQANSEIRSPAGFRAVEDEKLVIDSSQLRDGDGLGEVQIQWQISENGDDWMVIPGAVSEAFTPRDQQVGKYLRVQVSYIDGQGNPELINSPSSLAVENVNDTQLDCLQLLVMPVRAQAFTIDTSRMNDEDGIGAISYSWQRSKTKTDWETISEKDDKEFPDPPS